VVDYIGIAPQLKEALATYTAANGKGRPTIDSHAAFDVLKSKLREIRTLLEPLDWSGYREPRMALALLPQCLDHILALPEGKARYGDLVLAITKAFALCGTLEEALALSEEVAFLQGVRALLLKGEPPEGNGSGGRSVNHQLQQLLSEALVSEGVTDIFQACPATMKLAGRRQARWPVG
jgi:type I restriction enzyme R subunit